MAHTEGDGRHASPGLRRALGVMDNDTIETPDLITLGLEYAAQVAHDAGECGGYGCCDICYHEQAEDDADEVAREQAEDARRLAALDCCGGMVCRCPDDGPDQDGGV